MQCMNREGKLSPSQLVEAVKPQCHQQPVSQGSEGAHIPCVCCQPTPAQNIATRGTPRVHTMRVIHPTASQPRKLTRPLPSSGPMYASAWPVLINSHPGRRNLLGDEPSKEVKRISVGLQLVAGAVIAHAQ